MAMSQEEIEAMLTGPNPNDVSEEDVAADMADFEQKQREAMARMEQLRSKAQAGVVVRKPVPTAEPAAPTPPAAEASPDVPELEDVDLTELEDVVAPAETPAPVQAPAPEPQPEITAQTPEPEPEESIVLETTPLISETDIEEMEEISTRASGQTAALSSLRVSLEDVAEMLESDLEILEALEGLKETIDRVRTASQQIDQRIRRLLS